MPWLSAWLVFGLLVVNEVGDLDSRQQPELAVFVGMVYAAISACALLVWMVEQVRLVKWRPAALLAVFCAAGIGLALWWARHGDSDARWVATGLRVAVAAAAFFLFSLVASIVAIGLSLHGLAQREQALRAQLEARRQRAERLDRLGMPIDPPLYPVPPGGAGSGTGEIAFHAPTPVAREVFAASAPD